MRLHRFFVGLPLEENQAALKIDSPELTAQLRRVFRLKSGDSITLFNNTGFDFNTKIVDFDERSVVVEIKNKVLCRSNAPCETAVCAALVKKDKYEWIVEKSTELGVTRIIPIMAERSEKKSVNSERLNKISIEASEQSGRGTIPVIDPIKSLSETLESIKGIQAVAFHTDGEIFNRDLLKKNEAIAVFIGPEGGWSEKEIEMFHTHKIPIRSLGSQILRAETAVVAALSQVVFNN